MIDTFWWCKVLRLLKQIISEKLVHDRLSKLSAITPWSHYDVISPALSYFLLSTSSSHQTNSLGPWLIEPDMLRKIVCIAFLSYSYFSSSDRDFKSAPTSSMTWTLWSRTRLIFRAVRVSSNVKTYLHWLVDRRRLFCPALPTRHVAVPSQLFWTELVQKLTKITNCCLVNKERSNESDFHQFFEWMGCP